VKVVIAGGGTAGHVYPALALAQVLAEEHRAAVSFIGTTGGIEARLVPEAGFPFTAVRALPLHRELSLRAVAAPLTAVRSVAECSPVVADADVVVGVGGYVSVPAVLAAWRARRPVVVHEQNAVPGLANRLFARRARVVCASFAESVALLPSGARTVVTGNPVRRTIACVPARRSELRREAIAALDLDDHRRTALIFGGSQGALRIDRAVVGALDALSHRADLQLVVLTGSTHLGDVRAAAARPMDLRVRALAFLDRMELAYAAADVVLARSGATTVAELTVSGLASLLVPYPHATGNHQEANARALERAGAASIIPDRVLSPELLARRLTRLLEDEPALRRMRANAEAWSRPEAADALAAEVAAAGRRSR
jgi:UDP-N-acetylglucosamine--N-acetylmuramyl-(pentapeptide) pyrophosphoryl-undecaprenol N-acetylglucosamine transferase